MNLHDKECFWDCLVLLKWVWIVHTKRICFSFLLHLARKGGLCLPPLFSIQKPTAGHHSSNSPLSPTLPASHLEQFLPASVRLFCREGNCTSQASLVSHTPVTFTAFMGFFTSYFKKCYFLKSISYDCDVIQYFSLLTSSWICGAHGWIHMNLYTVHFQITVHFNFKLCVSVWLTILPKNITTFYRLCIILCLLQSFLF